jgi:hypothetical protein
MGMLIFRRKKARETLDFRALGWVGFSESALSQFAHSASVLC